jgi:RNA-directed DNA polymerase
MATRTTTTRTTQPECVPSADSNTALPFSTADLLQAYYDCRKHKRNKSSSIAFEMNLERNIMQLKDELITGRYTPGQSICFVITRPKPREVWAADFRDRIVHHLLYNKIAPRFERAFIADSCACIKGRGTLYAGKRIEQKIRSITQDWSLNAYYLKCDLANFFVSINKDVLLKQIKTKVTEPWWAALAELVLMHDPRTNYALRGSPELLKRVPEHKRLTNQNNRYGLPIGNLSSQFFANIYLNDLDQFVKHTLKVKHYIRYVDDFVLLHESPQQLNEWLAAINTFLPSLGVKLNPAKTILQPLSRGVDFVGHVIKPHRRTTRKKTIQQAVARIKTVATENLRQTANSYFGLARQVGKSQRSRAKIANAVLLRGRSVNYKLTKTFTNKLEHPCIAKIARLEWKVVALIHT